MADRGMRLAYVDAVGERASYIELASFRDDMRGFFGTQKHA
jgi:hypothetical protein